MPNQTKHLLHVACLMTAGAVGCSGSSPTAPSAVDQTGAVVAGVVTSGSASGGLTSSEDQGVVPVGLTVAVVGTTRSATVGASGEFEIPDVPSGDIQLTFKNGTVDATAPLPNVSSDQFIRLQVQVSNTSAIILNDERLRKISLCHAEGNGSYHLIDIDANAEQAHRDHGDGRIGDAVPGVPFNTFNERCEPVGPEVDIEKSTNGVDSDVAPGRSIPLGTPLAWEYVVTNTGTLNLSGIVVADDQGVAVSCPAATLAPAASMTCTAQGLAAELGQYRNVGTVTANFVAEAGSGSVTDSDASHYLGVSPIEIEKLTNGDDADTPTGPRIVVGTAVAWEYVLTNIGVVNLTGITVVDDQGEAVDCGGQSTLAPGSTLTCTAVGVATLGQYGNIGNVTASWAAAAVAGVASDSDPSHYLGVSDDDLEGPKVDLCHRTGNGSYHLINVSINAEPAHRAHGDAKVGEAVPGLPGRVFGPGCSVG